VAGWRSKNNLPLARTRVGSSGRAASPGAGWRRRRWRQRRRRAATRCYPNSIENCARWANARLPRAALRLQRRDAAGKQRLRYGANVFSKTTVTAAYHHADADGNACVRGGSSEAAAARQVVNRCYLLCGSASNRYIDGMFSGLGGGGAVR